MSLVSETVDDLVAVSSMRRPPKRRWRAAESPADTLRALCLYLSSVEPPQGELRAVFEVAESRLSGGDPDVAELIVSRLLEKLMLLASWPDSTFSWPDLLDAAPERCSTELTELDAFWVRVSHETPPSPQPLWQQRPDGLTGEVRDLFRTSYRIMSDGRFIGLADVLRWEVRQL